MLRTLTEPEGYRLTALDGDIGRCHDFLFDDSTRTLRFAVVQRSNLSVSREVLVALECIEKVSSVEQQVRVDIQVEQVEGAPEVDPLEPVNEELETVLYDYYGRPRGRG